MKINDPNCSILTQAKFKLFYIYVYLNPLKPGKYQYGEYAFDYEPYYVGMGRINGKRINDHYTRVIRLLEEVKYGKKMGTQTHKNNTTISIIRKGLEPIRLKIYDNLLECQAKKKEIYCIKTIGRNDLKNGPLCNMTDGGEGTSGRLASIETRKKMSIKKKGICIYEKNSRAKRIYVYNTNLSLLGEFNCAKKFIDQYFENEIILTKSNVSKYAYLNSDRDSDFLSYKSFVITFNKINTT